MTGSQHGWQGHSSSSSSALIINWRRLPQEPAAQGTDDASYDDYSHVQTNQEVQRRARIPEIDRTTAYVETMKLYTTKTTAPQRGFYPYIPESIASSSSNGILHCLPEV
mmetsp:Transcript_3273/g.4975  ORF Transcript_3273/g.4975 Transcript_3273/m.4975 type:complete len:109 (+) Transcript_3273:62-388(+)